MIMQNSIRISVQLLNLISQIDEFKGMWSAIEPTLPPAWLMEKAQGGFTESIGASIRLRGNYIPEQAIEVVLRMRVPSRPFATVYEQEAAGYADGLETIRRSWKTMQFNEYAICKLHGYLLNYSLEKQHLRGRYKTDANPILLNGADGMPLRPAVKTASPSETPQRMGELIGWINRELGAGQVHPLLSIAIFTGAFLALHPFQDGNFRLGHLLAYLLLRKAGYNHMPYGSWEKAIERYKGDYFSALLKTQQGLQTFTPKWEPWLVAFLTSLSCQAQELRETLEAYLLFEERAEVELAELPELSARIMEYVRQYKRVDMGVMADLTGISRNTLKVHFRNLVALDRLTMHGGGRGAWYSKS